MAGQAEELRSPVGAGVVADAHLDEAHAGAVEGVHHLDADHAADVDVSSTWSDQPGG